MWQGIDQTKLQVDKYKKQRLSSKIGFYFEKTVRSRHKNQLSTEIIKWNCLYFHRKHGNLQLFKKYYTTTKNFTIKGKNKKSNIFPRKQCQSPYSQNLSNKNNKQI